MIKALEIKTSVLFDLVFLGTLFHYVFFFFSLIIDLYLLIPAVIAQIYNPTAELAIPSATPTKEVNAQIKTQPLTAETKTRKFNLKPYRYFCFLFINSLCFTSSKR